MIISGGKARRQCWEVKLKIIKVGMSLEETLVQSQYDGVLEFVIGKNQWKFDGFVCGFNIIH